MHQGHQMFFSSCQNRKAKVIWIMINYRLFDRRNLCKHHASNSIQ